MKKLLLLSAALVAFQQSLPTASAEVKLSGLFSDHAVLQRDRPIPVWGTATAGDVVKVKLGKEEVQATADAVGDWHAELPKMAAGGPYELVVTGPNKVVVHDLLIGEVWLASGQSNMEIGLAIVTNAAQEFAAADHPKLRIFTVARNTAVDTTAKVGGSWVVSTPESAKMFSALPYLFGSILQGDLKVPVGIINSTVGNTPAEAWTPMEQLQADPRFAANATRQLTQLRNFGGADQVRGELEGWEKQYSAGDQGNSGFAKGWATAPPSPTEWKTIKLPINGAGLGIKGPAAIWVRREITLPEGKYTKPANLDLGPMRELDTTYFDGVKVGEAPPGPMPFDRNILYTVPASLLHPGVHTIAVRVFSHQPPQLYMGSRLANFNIPDPDGPRSLVKIMLSGEWSYRVEFEGAPLSDEAMKTQPMMIARPIFFPSVLYNGMIHPLENYAMRGIIWYQGENNAGQAAYGDLLTRMIASWRTQFQQPELPFYIVQLPNYDGGRNNWDNMRAQQEGLTKTVPNVAIAVAIDVGEPDNIHPRNKRPIADRLVALALHRVYGENIEDTGPTYKSMAVEGSKIRVSFTHAAGLLASHPAIPNFAIAGADQKFYPATAVIDGTTILVSSPDVPSPVAVRYARTQDPEGCDLYNGAHLPMAPFRTDDWPMK